MPRAWVVLQLVLGWLPVWALYAILILTSHPGVSFMEAAVRGLWAITTAALLGLGVWRVTARLPWPHPFRWRFAGAHLLLAAVYAGLFTLIVTAIEALHGPVPRLIAVDNDVARHVVVLSANWAPRFMILGVWFYVMVAGVAYATRGTERAARAEAHAARSQLAALRSQLNPHFLFNALHTVVQLIPVEPDRAGHAAELLAGLLRTASEEDRDLVPLGEEWAFVQRYLDLERMRFGDRLRVTARVDDDAVDALVPSFAVQTLVENAVRHGAAPKVESTEITVTASLRGGRLAVTVADTGAGAAPGAVETGTGTGLRRLRERLDALYEGRARLEAAPRVGAGFVAMLEVPAGPAEPDSDA